MILIQWKHEIAKANSITYSDYNLMKLFLNIPILGDGTMEYGKLSCKVKIKPVRQVCIVETCNHQDLPEYWRTPKKLSFVCESLPPLNVSNEH